MTNNTINNVPCELLETLIEQHITAHGFTNHTARQAQLILCAPSPAGGGGLEVVAWRIGFPNNAGYKVYEQRQPWAYEQYGVPSVIVYEVQELCRLSDALTQIACLEGEIAKRDEELAACRVAVENCELFRARIAELEQDLAYFPSTVRSLAETVTEREAEINQLRAELAAIKAQEPVIDAPYGGILRIEAGGLPDSWVRINPCKLYAAPVSEAKAQGVVMPEPELASEINRLIGLWDAQVGWSGQCMEELLDHAAKAATFIARLNATTVQQVSVPDGPNFILGDTGREDLDRLIGRLMSSDPDFEDCTAAAALLRRLFMEEISGPKGHATWKDAAVAERLRRVSMRPSETVVAMAREGLVVYSGPNMNEHKVCAEIVRLADISDTAMLAAPAAPAADAGIVDMYRHLQKVTPYRFKKIQDAAVTDGGDVLYFHKDRFDAALLADMAAHRANGVV